MVNKELLHEWWDAINSSTTWALHPGGYVPLSSYSFPKSEQERVAPSVGHVMVNEETVLLYIENALSDSSDIDEVVDCGHYLLVKISDQNFRVTVEAEG